MKFGQHVRGQKTPKTAFMVLNSEAERAGKEAKKLNTVEAHDKAYEAFMNARVGLQDEVGKANFTPEQDKLWHSLYDRENEHHKAANVSRAKRGPPPPPAAPNAHKFWDHKDFN